VFNIEYMEKKITKVTLVKIKVEEDNFVPKDVYYSEILQALMERAFGK